MVNYVKLLSGFSYVGIFFFSACQSLDKTPFATVSIGVNQSARLVSNVTVRADSIQDSRCPINADCLWVGQARVKLTLSKESESTSVWLALGRDSGPISISSKRPDSTNVLLGSSAYKVILQQVNPYPGTGNPGDVQTAIVDVTNL